MSRWSEAWMDEDLDVLSKSSSQFLQSSKPRLPQSRSAEVDDYVSRLERQLLSRNNHTSTGALIRGSAAKMSASSRMLPSGDEGFAPTRAFSHEVLIHQHCRTRAYPCPNPTPSRYPSAAILGSAVLPLLPRGALLPALKHYEHSSRPVLFRIRSPFVAPPAQFRREPMFPRHVTTIWVWARLVHLARLPCQHGCSVHQYCVAPLLESTPTQEHRCQRPRLAKVRHGLTRTLMCSPSPATSSSADYLSLRWTARTLLPARHNEHNRHPVHCRMRCPYGTILGLAVPRLALLLWQWRSWKHWIKSS